MTDNELKALCDAATPGPWIRSGVRYKFDGRVDCLTVGPDKAGAPAVLCPIGTTHNEHADAMNDAAFISAARAAIPRLLAEKERLRRELLCRVQVMGDCPAYGRPCTELTDDLDHVCYCANEVAALEQGGASAPTGEEG